MLQSVSGRVAVQRMPPGVMVIVLRGACRPPGARLWVAIKPAAGFTCSRHGARRSAARICRYRGHGQSRPQHQPSPPPWSLRVAEPLVEPGAGFAVAATPHVYRTLHLELARRPISSANSAWRPGAVRPGRSPSLPFPRGTRAEHYRSGSDSGADREDICCSRRCCSRMSRLHSRLLTFGQTVPSRPPIICSIAVV